MTLDSIRALRDNERALAGGEYTRDVYAVHHRHVAEALDALLAVVDLSRSYLAQKRYLDGPLGGAREFEEFERTEERLYEALAALDADDAKETR